MSVTFDTHISSNKMSAPLPFRSLAAIISENPLFSLFPIEKAKVTQFELSVKSVKVTPGSSFEQTMKGRSPQCYIPSFVEICLSVPEKKNFEEFLPYMGVAAILVM